MTTTLVAFTAIAAYRGYKSCKEAKARAAAAFDWKAIPYATNRITRVESGARY